MVPLNDGFRLADLLSGLSFVSDMGLGLPPEDAMRCCLVGTALVRQFDGGRSHTSQARAALNQWAQELVRCLRLARHYRGRDTMTLYFSSEAAGARRRTEVSEGLRAQMEEMDKLSVRLPEFST